MPNASNALRGLPSVSRLLAAPALAALAERLPAALLTQAARTVLAATREELAADGNGNGNGAKTPPDFDALAARTAREALRQATPSLQRAINATGIVLHTGLGRARLADAARDALLEIASAHSTVEIDRETGRRGARRDHVRGLLCELTGAEDATVVNNCAGAVFLAVTALASGREVVISRGELVEIGGAFRMPDIVRAGGAALVEVGTTNRTRLADYEAALTERTGLILRCQPSNFALIGFTEAALTSELAALGRQHNIPVMDDQGSGALLTLADLGLHGSSADGKGGLRASVASGADIIAASGDKLLGGPQAGLLLGRREIIARIAGHPLARALRVDKFTLAALEATLRLYRDPDLAREAIPTLRYLTRSETKLRGLAQRLRNRLTAVLPADRFTVTLVAENSQVGGGSLPGESLPTTCVALRATNGTPSADAIAAILRQHTPPVFARIKDGATLFDPRTLEPDEIAVIAAATARLTQT